MLGSLRFRLPALFLLGVVLSGLVASLIAIHFFQSYERTRAIAELRSETAGVVQLYALQIGRAEVPVRRLERALGGDKIFYAPVVRGVTFFTGPLTQLPVGTVDLAALNGGRTVSL